ncbi:MAG TPA: nucleotide exchange factor GrpE [Saprospiraceae bacterium]|nr:nucleotide exchange factor GrpE [Saprospiraceae bacterium]HRO73759.1 nucleotide exchange factor GrpE [Saprospiraceae bacterium]HRP43014.1 nucleotide exchange factor GrpE [Saprospiraceae bacterium]
MSNPTEDKDHKKNKGKKKGEDNQIQIETLETEVAKLNEELGESKDKYLRLFAEFDNFKKRNAKERLDLIKTAAQETIQAILPVLDDFDRAKKSAEAGTEVFSEGVQLVYHKLHTILENLGLKGMDTDGVEFNMDLHEAITDIPAPTEDMKGKVIDTITKGYYLNDKIIRYAKVVVGK